MLQVSQERNSCTVCLLTLIQFLRTMEARSPDPVAMTIPGLSSSFICLSSWISCKDLTRKVGEETEEGQGGKRGTFCLIPTTKMLLLGTRILSIEGCYTLHEYFVTPGVAPTVHVLDLFKLLMMLLLPTLGRPEVKYSTYVITSREKSGPSV